MVENSDIDLEVTFESRPSKWLAVAFSSLAALLTSTLLIGIINYEANNHHRVLMGRLVSLNAQAMLLYNYSAQVKFLSLTLDGLKSELLIIYFLYKHTMIFSV